MKRAGALDACVSLERREAALARAGYAAAVRCAQLDTDDERLAFRARCGLAREARWTAVSCAFLHARSERSAVERADRAARSQAALRVAREHETRRRHWATLVRGLQRRAARRALRAEGSSCPA